MFGCMLCGAFAWKRRGKQVETCPRRPTTPCMRAQLSKLQDQCFPGEEHKAIRPLRQRSPEELDWLARCTRAPQGAAAKASKEDKALQKVLSRCELLREFDILAQDHVDAWRSVACKAAGDTVISGTDSD